MNRILRCLIPLLFLLAACEPESAVSSTPVDSAGQPKQLATVFISPTPDEAQRQATQVAAPPLATAVPVLPTAAPTAYVGVFLGEAVDEGERPVISLVNPARPTVPGVVEPSNCLLQADPVYGSAWSTDPAVTSTLGCALQPTVPFRGVVQIFERGVMYWRGDTNEIWAIATSGPAAGRYWYAANLQEGNNDDLTAPEGLRLPVRGFGMMWRSVAGVRDSLGYARIDEQELSMQSQRFEGGLLHLDNAAGQVFVLLVDGRAFGPY
ncbi:MAG: hypothetical protein H6672_21880 [Anaerolineaceae bacterium]|nr:hypothetical protein [Anaerolineaceae bacterium]